MADPRKLSVSEMLAAARKADGGDSAPQGGEKPDSAAPAEAASSASSAPAKPKPAAAAKKPGQMSVAEMLAAARGEKAPGEAKAADAPAKPAPKPAAKPAPAAKEKPAPAAKADGGASAAKPRDTASILAAARGEPKPGPLSKAEAAAKGTPVSRPSGAPGALPMPEKPAYARPAAPPPTAETRRGFFAQTSSLVAGSFLAIGFSSLAVTHLLWVLGFARFMFPNILIEPPTRFKVGFPSDYGTGQVEEKYKAQFGVWIVRWEYEGQQQVYALKTVCTHLGCTPNWLEGEQKFKCPCHGSGFYKDGINFEGPAPRPLERYAIRIADDGQLEVDKSQTFLEEMGQWKDSASYVTV